MLKRFSCEHNSKGCPPCRSARKLERAKARHQARKAANPEKLRAQNKANSAKWRSAHPEYSETRNARRLEKPVAWFDREYSTSQAWRRANPERALASGGVVFPEGITVARLRAKQAERCHACGKAQTFVDHDHKTGLVRGLLCRNCNLSLGYAQDCAERLRRLADYLENSPVQQLLTQSKQLEFDFS